MISEKLSERQKETKRDPPTSGLLPKCPQPCGSARLEPGTQNSVLVSRLAVKDPMSCHLLSPKVHVCTKLDQKQWTWTQALYIGCCVPSGIFTAVPNTCPLWDSFLRSKRYVLHFIVLCFPSEWAEGWELIKTGDTKPACFEPRLDTPERSVAQAVDSAALFAAISCYTFIAVQHRTVPPVWGKEFCSFIRRSDSALPSERFYIYSWYCKNILKFLLFLPVCENKELPEDW